MGGLIEIDGDQGHILVSSSSERSESGSQSLTSGQTLVVKMNNGKIVVGNSPSDDLTWSCRSYGRTSDVTPTTSGKSTTLDFSMWSRAKCELQMPKGGRLEIAGHRGKLEFDQPRYNLVANLDSGRIEFAPDAEEAYHYAVSVARGQMDLFESSDKPDAHTITLHVNNGQIRRK